MTSHLEFDMPTRTVSLLRFPSFCRMVNREDVKTQPRVVSWLCVDMGNRKSEIAEQIKFDSVDTCKEIISSYCLQSRWYFSDLIRFDVEQWAETKTALLLGMSGYFPDPILQMLCR
jgi:hypothetical protein